MYLRVWRYAALGGALCALAGTASATLLTTGKPIPAWSGKTTAGKAISADQYKGKALLVNFFSYG